MSRTDTELGSNEYSDSSIFHLDHDREGVSCIEIVGAKD